MTTVRIQLHEPLEYQRDVLFGPERYAIIEGSTKVGKTYPCILWLLTEMGKRGGDNRGFWWVAPTHAQAEIVYGRLKTMLRQADPEQITWSHNDTRKRIFINGLGVAEFKTGEDPDNLYGDDVYAAVMDEFTRQREEAWIALRSTLTATGGHCRMIGNVKGRKNWGYKLARRAERGESGMRYRKLTADHAVTAGIMTAAELEDARKVMPETAFRELYYAEASDDGSNPFGISHIRAAIRPMSGLTPVCFGVDLARKFDYTVVIGLDENGHVCRHESWNKMSWDYTVDRIVQLVNGCPTLVDSTGVGDAVLDRIQKRAPRADGYVFTQKSKSALIESLAVDIQGGKIGYPDGQIVRQLESFEFVPTRLGVTYSAPAGEHDDEVVALALAAKQHVANAIVPQFYFGVSSVGRTGDF